VTRIVDWSSQSEQLFKARIVAACCKHAMVLEFGEEQWAIRPATPDEIALLSQRRIERMVRFPIPIVQGGNRWR